VALDFDSLKQELRTRLGEPSEASLPDEQLDAALTGALREYSRHRPRWANATLDVVAGQDTYPLPANAEEVSDVWARPSLDVLQLPFDALSVAGVQGFPIHSFGALNLLYPTKLSTGFLDDLVRMGFTPMDDAVWETRVDVAQDPPVLVITPVPQRDLTLAFKVEFSRAAVDVPEKDADLLLLYAEGDCLEFIGRKRSKSVKQIPTATGSLRLDNGAELRLEGRQLKKDFAAKLGTGATVVAKG
jgi:hypothetical protein